MPLLFAHSAAAWLLPAVALPVIFHLFFRLRRQVQEFPSLMFFLRIDPRLSAKRKIHEWLILFLRCLFIATLLLALLRPVLGLKGAGGSVARLVLIDNSGSMAGSADGRISKLVLSERATDKMIDSMRPGDSLAVQLMIPDVMAAVPGGFDAAPSTLRDSLGKVTSSDGAAPVARAIRTALATLAAARAPQHELHILTDLQQENWSQGKVEAQASDCDIIVHRISSAPLKGGSVSLQIAEAPERSIPVGRITPIRVALQNHGPVAAHVRLNATDDSGKNFSRQIEVGSKDSAPAALTFSFGNPGFHWARIWIEGDTAPTATSAYLGFWCTDVRKVLFVGDREDFAALPSAVSPGGTPDLSGIATEFVSPQQTANAFAIPPLAAAATWERWPSQGGSSQILEQYVRQGGTLFLVPTPDIGASLPPPAAPWLEANLGAMQTVAANHDEPLILWRDGDAIWHDLQDAEGRPRVGSLRAFRYRPLRLGVGWQVLVSSAKGDPLLARRDLDHGQIFASGVAFTPQWSSLPLKAGFVVLVQNAIFGNQSEHTPVKLIKAAEDFGFDLPFGAADVKSLAGDAIAWQGSAREFLGFPRAGVYEIRQQDKANWVATSGNAAETVPDFLSTSRVPVLRSLPHRVLELKTPEDINSAGLSSASGIPGYRWLILIALLLLLLETWLANERSSDLGAKLFHSLLPSTIAKKPAPDPAKEPSRV